MESFKVYKDRAIKSLSGKWGKGVIATFLYVLMTDISYTVLLNCTHILISLRPDLAYFCITVFLLMILLSFIFLLPPLELSFTVFFLGIARGENMSYGRLFDGFKEYKRIFTTTLLVYVYTLLWTLLLFGPGVIKWYSYRMTPYILKDNPEMKNNEAIEKSMEMMDGHKVDLFLLDLSFIGWEILSILTLGIGYLFLYPYIYTTHAHFYEDLKEEQERYEAARVELGLV